MAIRASEIFDEDSLREWLKGQLFDVARVIASRAALRVLPIALSIHQENENSVIDENKLALSINLFRMSFISWVASKYPTHNLDTFAKRAFYARPAYPPATDDVDFSVAAVSAAARARAGAGDGAPAVAYAAAAAYSVAAYAAVRGDAEWLENNPDAINELVNQPLWLEPSGASENFDNLQEHIKEKFDAFRKSDLAKETSFGLITDWYAALLPEKGKPRSLFGEKKDIELATKPKEFWEGEAQEVMDRVAELVGYGKPKTRFFISYSSKDEVAAKFIGGVIKDAGYQVFAQYKDMPAGSVFIEEMKRGLAGSDRFVPIYSPNYEKSDFCQAEWNAAFRLDPLGVHRKILPFMIEPTKLNNLASTISYVSLVNQTDDELRETILNALDIEVEVEIPPIKPAAIMPEWRDGKLSLPREPIENDFTIGDIDQALSALKKELQGFSKDIGKSNNIDPRIVEYISQLAEEAPETVPTQEEFFRFAHKEEVLRGLVDHAAQEWDAMLAARFGGLTLNFSLTVQKFPPWREFIKVEYSEIHSQEDLEKVKELEAMLAENLQDELAEEFVDSQLPQALSALANDIPEINSVTADDRALPVFLQRQGHDVLESISNILKELCRVILSNAKRLGVHTAEIIKDEIPKTYEKVVRYAVRGGIMTIVYAALKMSGAFGAIFNWLQTLLPLLELILKAIVS